MSQETLLGIIAVIGVIFAAAIGAPRIIRDARWSIRRDLEILSALPPESTARQDLLLKIDRDVN